jgi:LAO/AO transport system kinase
VVVNPGWGDAVQANKAGLMEIADIFVINKSDRPGAEETRRDLEAMLDLTDRGDDGAWRPPVVDTVATDGTGVDELWEAVGRHRAHLETTGELARRRGRRAREELTRIVAERLLERARHTAEGDRFEQLADDVELRGTDPWSAADALLGDHA